MFFKLKYTVHEANYSLSKIVFSSIDFNTKVPQDGAGMYPGSDVTFIIQLMNSSTLYVERSIRNSTAIHTKSGKFQNHSNSKISIPMPWCTLYIRNYYRKTQCTLYIMDYYRKTQCTLYIRNYYRKTQCTLYIRNCYRKTMKINSQHIQLSNICS